MRDRRMERRMTMRSAWWAAGLLAVVPLGAAAQTRVDVRISAPQLQPVGQSNALRQFQAYSFGLGSLESRSRGVVSSPLMSSIGQTNTFSLNRGNPALPPTGLSGAGGSSLRIDRSIGGLGAGASLPYGPGGSAPIGGPVANDGIAPVAATGRRFASDGPGLLSAGGAGNSDNLGIGRALAEQDETAFGAARAYVQALEEASTSLLRDRSAPITTLVPAPESPYRDYMLRADTAFRAGNFRDAYANFEIANDLGDRDPESYLCLLHTQFALSRYTYAKACYFLEQALKVMPELALARLRPRGFYGSVGKYAEHLVALEEYLERNPADGEALLVLAYFRWFGEAQDVRATHEALGRAMASALQRKDAHVVEAVETFWDGMVASGKVQGPLQPAAAPASASPAAAPAVPAGPDRP